MAKYVSRKGNQLWYQRGWPASVASFTDTAKYRLNLNLPYNAPEHDVLKAAGIAEEAFQLEVQRLTNSDATTSIEGVIDRLADRQLKRIRLRDRDLDPSQIPVEQYDGLRDMMDAKKEDDSGDLKIRASGNVELTPDMIRQIVEMATKAT